MGALQSGGREEKVVLVDGASVSSFQKKLDALNRKAAKFGLPALEVVGVEDAPYRVVVEPVGGSSELELSRLVPAAAWTDNQRSSRLVVLKRIRLLAPLVKCGEWQVVGRLEQIEGGVLSYCFTEESSDQLMVRELALNGGVLTCQHCGKVRRRKEFFVLRSSTSREIAQEARHQVVGSSCLNDFAGIDPGAALFLARMTLVLRGSEDDVDEGVRGGRFDAVDTRSFLADVAFLIRQGRFTSVKASNETGHEPTCDEAMRMATLLETDRELLNRYRELRAECLETAESVIQDAIASDDESDFARNTRLLLQLPALSVKRGHRAIAAAAVWNHFRSKTRREAAAQSRHVGEVGEKLAVEVTIRNVVEIPNLFSRAARFMVIMCDAAGNALKWTTAAAPRELREGIGKTMNVQFTVKGHSEYKGQLQTEVVRLKLRP